MCSAVLPPKCSSNVWLLFTCKLALACGTCSISQRTAAVQPHMDACIKGVHPFASFWSPRWPAATNYFARGKVCADLTAKCSGVRHLTFRSLSIVRCGSIAKVVAEKVPASRAYHSSVMTSLMKFAWFFCTSAMHFLLRVWLCGISVKHSGHRLGGWGSAVVALFVLYFEPCWCLGSDVGWLGGSSPILERERWKKLKILPMVVR